MGAAAAAAAEEEEEEVVVWHKMEEGEDGLQIPLPQHQRREPGQKQAPQIHPQLHDHHHHQSLYHDEVKKATRATARTRTRDPFMDAAEQVKAQRVEQQQQEQNKSKARAKEGGTI